MCITIAAIFNYCSHRSENFFVKKCSEAWNNDTFCSYCPSMWRKYNLCCVRCAPNGSTNRKVLEEFLQVQDVQQRDEMLFRRLGSLIVEKDIEDQLEEGEIDEHEEMRKVDEICDLLRFTEF